MDDEIRRREAQRQGRAAYEAGRDRNPKWPKDVLEAYDRAQDEAIEEVEQRVNGPSRPRSQPIDLAQFTGGDE